MGEWMGCSRFRFQYNQTRAVNCGIRTTRQGRPKAFCFDQPNQPYTHWLSNVTTSTLQSTSRKAKLINDLCRLYATTGHIKNTECTHKRGDVQPGFPKPPTEPVWEYLHLCFKGRQHPKQIIQVKVCFVLFLLIFFLCGLWPENNHHTSSHKCLFMSRVICGTQLTRNVSHYQQKPF